jgi:hypothetical protein
MRPDIGVARCCGIEFLQRRLVTIAPRSDMLCQPDEFRPSVQIHPKAGAQDQELPRMPCLGRSQPDAATGGFRIQYRRRKMQRNIGMTQHTVQRVLRRGHRQRQQVAHEAPAMCIRHVAEIAPEAAGLQRTIRIRNRQIGSADEYVDPRRAMLQCRRGIIERRSAAADHRNVAPGKCGKIDRVRGVGPGLTRQLVAHEIGHAPDTGALQASGQHQLPGQRDLLPRRRA